MISLYKIVLIKYQFFCIAKLRKNPTGNSGNRMDYFQVDNGEVEFIL